MRYSARVSRFGPGTATYTPSRSAIPFSCHRRADGAQRLVVRRAHVGKPVAERRIVIRPDQRIVAEQVDVVGNQHQVARRPLRMHAAARVRHDERRRAQRAQHAHRERHLLQRVALVAVKAALHRHHPLAAERPAHEPARVRFHRREWETRDVGVRDLALDGDLARRDRPGRCRGSAPRRGARRNARAPRSPRPQSPRSPATTGPTRSFRN